MNRRNFLATVGTAALIIPVAKLTGKSPDKSSDKSWGKPVKDGIEQTIDISGSSQEWATFGVWIKEGHSGTISVNGTSQSGTFHWVKMEAIKSGLDPAWQFWNWHEVKVNISGSKSVTLHIHIDGLKLEEYRGVVMQPMFIMGKTREPIIMTHNLRNDYKARG